MLTPLLRSLVTTDPENVRVPVSTPLLRSLVSSGPENVGVSVLTPLLRSLVSSGRVDTLVANSGEFVPWNYASSF